jgi:hypothetical protein
MKINLFLTPRDDTSTILPEQAGVEYTKFFLRFVAPRIIRAGVFSRVVPMMLDDSASCSTTKESGDYYTSSSM